MKSSRSRDGAGLVEFSLVASLIALALIVILALVGTGVIGVFQNVINGLTGQSSSSPSALVVNITNLDVTTPGDLGPSVLASVTVSGPGGYTHALTTSTTFNDLAPGTYLITANPVVGQPSQLSVPVTFYPTVTPASITIPSAAHTALVDYTNAVPASTHAVIGADLALLASVTGNATSGYTLTFSSPPSFAPIQIGDVLVAGISTPTPAGLQIKVTSVTGNSVTGSEASFPEVFARANINSNTTSSTSSFSLPAISSLASSTALSSLTAAAPTLAPHAFSPVTFGCGNVTLSFSGSFDQNFYVNFILKINWPWLDQSGDQFGVTVNDTLTYSLGIDSTQITGIFCQIAVPLVEPIPLPPIIMPPIGVIPIEFINELTFNATVQVGWSPTTHPFWTMAGHTTLVLGFLCTSAGCSGIYHGDFPSPVLQTPGTGSVLMKFGPRINMKIDGIIGPYYTAYVYEENVTTVNISPTCQNGEAGLALSAGLTAGLPFAGSAFGNLWSFQFAERKFPFVCIQEVPPPGNPSLITGAIDNRGCANAGCISTDGYNTPGNATGPGQIQFNPDNSRPRYSVEGSVVGTLHFPATLGTTSNFPGSCLDPVNTVPANCPFALALAGRTDADQNGAQLGRWTVTDGNGYVYTPNNPAGCPGEIAAGPFPCNDIVLFGQGNHGYNGPGAADPRGCGGNECVAGAQLNANCKSAAGVNESCAGHTLIVQLWVESNAPNSYPASGSQAYPEQAVSWFDGATVGMPYYPAPNNHVISSNAADGTWHCDPADPTPTYNAPCA